MAIVAAMPERRKKLRMKAGKLAQISFEQKKIPCTVVDLSLDGACLELSEASAVPESFELIFSGYGTVKKCRVMWRSGKELGVAFTS
jgi:hypothetical protein